MKLRHVYQPLLLINSFTHFMMWFFFKDDNYLGRGKKTLTRRGGFEFSTTPSVHSRIFSSGVSTAIFINVTTSHMLVCLPESRTEIQIHVASVWLLWINRNPKPAVSLWALENWCLITLQFFMAWSSILCCVFKDAFCKRSYLKLRFPKCLAQGCPIIVLVGHCSVCFRCSSAPAHLIWTNGGLKDFCWTWRGNSTTVFSGV